MKKILLNVLSVLLVLAIFYFLGRELSQNWAEIRAYTFHFRPLLLFLSALTYFGAFVLLCIGWYWLLAFLRHPVPFFESLLYFFITQPAKYIPGKIWIAVARMKFCNSHAVPNKITFLTTGTEAVLEIMAGAYISLIAILQTDLFGKFSVIGTLAITAVGLALLSPRIFYFFIDLYLRIVKGEPLPREKRVSFQKLLLLQLIYLVGVFLLGLSQYFFLQSFAPVGWQHFPFLISLGAFSYVASILAVFAPSGLGVREGIWYLGLKGIAGDSISLIYAFVSRIWAIIIEAILVFVSIPFLLRRRAALNQQHEGNRVEREVAHKFLNAKHR